nr:uncharacterized protein PF11_0213 isoform X2 [Osmia lignaria]
MSRFESSIFGACNISRQHISRSSKSEQYEDYHRKIDAIYMLPENTNNGIDKIKKVEDRNPKRNVTVKYLPSEVKRKPSSQMVWLDYQTNPSISLSSSNLINEAKGGLQHTTQLKPLNQQISNTQNMFHIHQLPQLPQQNSIQNVPLENLSLQHFQYKLPYRQIDSDLYVSKTFSNLPLNSLSEQDVTYLSKSPKQMEPIQVKSRYTNSDISYHKSLNVPQSQSKGHINSTVGLHSFRPESRKISLSNTPLRMKNVNYRSTPVTVERIRPSTSLSRATSNSPKCTFQSYSNYPLRNVNRLQKSVADTPMRSLMLSNNEYFPSKNLNDVKISQESKKSSMQESESRTATIIENELDKYIANIYKLHQDHNMQSLNYEENKNTSSDNDRQYYAENQSNENLSKDIEEVLALAGDLASKTADLNDAIDIPISEKNRAVHEGFETSVVVEKDKISADTTLYDPKLNLCENVEKPEQQLSTLHVDQNIDSVVLSNDKFTEQNDDANVILKENLHHEKPFKEHGVFVSKESQLDHCSFEAVEELKPWDLDSIQKQIKEAMLTVETENEFSEDEIINNIPELNEDNTKKVEEINEVTIAKSQVGNQDFKKETNLDNINDQLNVQSNDYLELKEDPIDNCKTETSEVSDLPNKRLEDVQYYMNNENITENSEPEHYTFTEQKEIDNVQTDECYETNESNVQEYNDQNYIEESNQAQNYMDNFKTEQFNLNEEYSCNQNMSYEVNQDINYDQNVPSHDSQQQEYQEYVQESNEHNSENQYEHVYNIQSQENLDQQNACYQQPDPNQASETNMDQSHEYMDFNRSEIMQRDEDKPSKYEQSQQEIEEVSEKFNESQNKSTKALTENESNPKKDVIKSLLDSDTDSTIERNVSNTESDFDFN